MYKRQGVREQVDVLEREGWVLKMCFGVREQVDALERRVSVEMCFGVVVCEQVGALERRVNVEDVL